MKIDKVKLRYRAYLAVTSALALLPLRALYVLADGIAFLLHRVLRYRLKVVRRNIATSFPEMTTGEHRRIERDFYRNLADVIVENIKLLHISDAEIDRRVHVTNPEMVTRIAGSGTPIVLFLAHYANWEWVTAITRHFDTNRIFGGHIYLEQHDKAADMLMQKVRSRNPSIGIEVKEAPRRILELGRSHRAMIVGFISDHRFNGVPRRQSTMFLNHDTPYYLGGEVLGAKIGAEYLYLEVERTGRGHYRLTYKRIEPTGDGEPHPVTRAYYRMLERTIRRRPGYWLWSHRRWPEIFE